MAKIAMLKPRVATLDTSLAPPPPKTADPWYLTPEHQAWSAEVIRRAGGKCQDPAHKDTGRPYRVVADHIKERRDRPDLALVVSNGLCRCWPCHTTKTNDERAKRHRGETSR
jgi:5-methylcytosine-specific restriction protein A